MWNVRDSLYHLECGWLWMLQPVTIHSLPQNKHSILQLTWVLIAVWQFIKYTVQTLYAPFSERFTNHQIVVPPHSASTLQLSAFPPYLEFCHFLFQAWKMPGICSKSGQNLEFNSKPGKKMKFANSMFRASLFKMSFTKIILIYFVVYIINTLIQSQIDLQFHCFYLETTWKIHGI